MSFVVAVYPLRSLAAGKLGQIRLRRIVFALGVLVLAALAFPGSTEATSLNEVKKLTVSNAEANDRFGRRVVVSGDTIVVGTPFENFEGGSGGVAVVGTHRMDPEGSFAGAVYVFQRDQGGTDNWGQVVRLTASDAQSGDVFGASMAMSGDTIIVGAYNEDTWGSNAGAAYVFQRNQGGEDSWGQVKKLTASDARVSLYFGFDVAISGDTIVVGAFGENTGGVNVGAMYAFYRDEGGTDNWGEVAKLTASDAQAGDWFGYSVSISGDTAVVGAYLKDTGGSKSGAMYIFQRGHGGADNWGQVKKLTASDGQSDDHFGFRVAVSADTVITGAPGEDTEGNGAGAVYVYYRGEGGTDNWGEVIKVTAADAQAGDVFGTSVAISGDTAIVGAGGADAGGTSASAVYVLRRNENGADGWGEVKKLTASDAGAGDGYGFSLALTNAIAVVGAGRQDVGGITDTGAAYVFQQLPPPPVGGIVPDSDLRLLPLELSSASGRSYGVVMLSIALAAALALLAGIGLYATRRWPR